MCLFELHKQACDHEKDKRRQPESQTGQRSFSKTMPCQGSNIETKFRACD